MGRARILKWVLRSVLGSALLAIFIVLGLRHFRGTLGGRPGTSEPSVHSAGPSDAGSPSSGTNTLIFAGLSGQPPKFIDSGPERGLGWLEYHTQEIRKGLKQDGFDIQMEYMTPARIAHEFRVQSPICFYPTEWNNPKEVFKQKPDRVYSIPLDIAGEGGQSIMFRKEDFAKFKKHLDSKGDLKLDSLFHDTSLKTLLIRDKDYGSLGRTLTEVNSEGEQVVRPEFRKNVILLVLRDNRQIAEMLNAGRFDYTVSEAVEVLDLTRSGIDPNRFSHLNFSRPGVKDKRDPNLKFFSVACSIHPLTLRAMPYLNRWISLNRGNDWTSLKLRYQAVMDPKVPKTFESYQTTASNFRGEFTKGELEFWYPDQQKYFPGLLLFPPERERHSQMRKSSLGPMRAARQPLWTEFTEGDALVILSESLPYFRQEEVQSSNAYLKSATFVQRPLHDLFSGDFTSKQLSRLQTLNLRSFSSDLQRAESFSRLKISSQARKIKIFGHLLVEADGPKLSEVLSKLQPTELSVFQASPRVTRILLRSLPPLLTSVNLTGSSVALVEDLSTHLGKLPLKKLNLSDAQVSEAQLGELLKVLPPSLEELSLGNNRVAWSDRNLKILESVQLPKLRVLDLENNFLTDSQLLSLSKMLPSGLQILRLGWNLISPRSLSVLFSKSFPNLVELDLSNSVLGGFEQRGPFRYRLPPSLRRFTCKWGVFGDTALEQLLPGAHLESLDLEATQVGDELLASLVSRLKGSLALLNLSQTGLGTKSLRALVQNKGIESVETLNLAGNNLGNEEVLQLVTASFQVSKLSLGRNKVSDPGVALLSEKWIPRLVDLDLSYNPITEKGTRAIASSLNPQLDSLALGGLFSVDLSSLAEHLPKNLVSLGLENNQISNAEIRLLAPHLPETLLSLNLKKSAFSEDGLADLVRALPPRLRELDLQLVPIGGVGMTLLTQGLPPTLTALKVGPFAMVEGEAEEVAQSLPRGLQDLWVHDVRGKVAPLFARLPDSISRLRIYNSKLDSVQDHAVQNWPSALREIYWDGLDLASSAQESFFQDFPETIERIALFGGSGLAEAIEAGFKTRGKSLLGSYLHTLQLWRVPVSPAAFNKLLLRMPRIQVVEFGGLQRMASKDWSALPVGALSSVKSFTIVGNATTDASILVLARGFPRDLAWCKITSSGITAAGVKALIALLPEQVHRLHVTGNPFGQNGLELVRAYKSRREKEDGFPFDLVE